MGLFTIDAPKHLYNKGVDFQRLDIPVAAQFYYRMGLWLKDCGCLERLMPGTTEALATTYRNSLGCAALADEALTEDETSSWKDIGRIYEKELQTIWRSVWRVVKERVRVNAYRLSSAVVLNFIMNDVSRDAEIAELHKFAPYVSPPQPMLPNGELNLTDQFMIDVADSYDIATGEFDLEDDNLKRCRKKKRSHKAV